MRPFYVEESCLKCHEQQGYKSGDVRGGISVTVPVDSMWAAQTQQARKVFIVLGGIWMLGAVAIVLVGKSIHRRQLERERAIETLAQFSAIVNSSQDAIIGKTLDGIITSWNGGAERLYGYTAEEVVGQSILILLPPNRNNELSSLLRKIKQGERIEHFDTVRRRKDGSLVDVSLTISPITYSDGKIVGTSTSARDITERKRAEEALRESEHRYRTLVDNIDLGITLIDPQHRIVMVNKGHAGMFHRTARECVGQECYRLFEQRETVCPHCPGVRAMQTGIPAEVETQGVRDDGSTFFVRLRAFPLSDSAGAPTGFIEVVEDITERKRNEEALRQSKEELEQYTVALMSSNQALEEFSQAAEAANQTKSEFLANMSHEIRTPMTAILGFADVLLENSVTEEAIESTRIIQRNGNHLLQLINDILDLSKIEAGKYEVEQVACSLRDIATEAVALMKVRADAKGLPLTLEVLEDVPEKITTDPTRLRQILVNLLGNAIKFTEVGSVQVVLRVDGISDCDAKLRFDVIDTGIGIAEEQQALLFQPFSQVDASARRRFGGTGLGLAISKRLAGMLGGDIVVRSTLGHGSTFSLSIGIDHLDGPTTTHEPCTATQSVGDAQPKLNYRILLAEDGPDNQRLIAHVLRKAGAEVTVAENGQIAIDLATTAEQTGHSFDVILMDIQMPVMDGYEATRHLRNAGYKGPIIALTAHAMTEDRQKCLDAGCDDYASKPIDRQRLLDTVAKWARNAVISGKEVDHDNQSAVVPV